MAVSTPVGQVSPPDLGPMEKSDPVLVAYLRRLGLWMTTQLQTKLPIRTATPFVLLLSPNGTVYRLTVDDSGALITTNVPAGTMRIL